MQLSNNTKEYSLGYTDALGELLEELKDDENEIRLQ